MDAALSQLTLACALEVEERAARRGGARTARVGLAGSIPPPEGRLASFGLAGSLVPGLHPGTVLTATRIVDEQGSVLWEGEPLPVPGAREAVICSAGRVVDGASERSALAARTGAIAVEMEGRALAATGRLAGAIKAIADGPERPVGRLARASTPDGRTAWPAVARAFLTEPVTATRSAAAARRALSALERTAALIGEGSR